MGLSWQSLLTIGLAGFLVIFDSLLVLLGWHLGMVRLVCPSPAVNPFPYTTALGFGLAGLAVMSTATQRYRMAGVVIVCLVVLALTVLGENFLALDPSISQLVLDLSGSRIDIPAGRTSVNTAIAFLLVAGALYCISRPERQPRLALSAILLAVPVFMLGLTAVGSFILGIDVAPAWGISSHSCPREAIGLCVLSLLVGLLTRERKPLKELSVDEVRSSLLAAAITGTFVVALSSAYFSILPLHDLLGIQNSRQLAILIRERVREGGGKDFGPELSAGWGPQIAELLAESRELPDVSFSLFDAARGRLYELDDESDRLTSTSPALPPQIIAECQKNGTAMSIGMGRAPITACGLIKAPQLFLLASIARHGFHGEEGRHLLNAFVISLLLGATGALSAYLLMGHLLARSKALDEQLKESLKVKDVLLREVHHRVKNNMQLISSLLSLESREVSSPEFDQVFKETQGRIRTMALLHDLLYRSSGLDVVEFQQFLKVLLERMAITASLKNPVQTALDVETGSSSFDLDTAIPLGLIANEIISALFSITRENAKVAVSLRTKGDRRSLVIAASEKVDNPLPPLKSDIVKSLVRQLRGELRGPLEPGTIFELEF